MKVGCVTRGGINLLIITMFISQTWPKKSILVPWEFTLYYSIHLFYSTNPLLLLLNTSPPMKSSWNIFLKLCAYIHPIVPRPLLPTILIFHFVLSSPPNHCTPIHRKQDKHYLKWNRMNIKQLGHTDWATVFSSLHHLCPTLSMLQRLHDKESYELHQPCRWVLLPYLN